MNGKKRVALLISDVFIFVYSKRILSIIENYDIKIFIFITFALVSSFC